jgi:hypothetical protein
MCPKGQSYDFSTLPNENAEIFNGKCFEEIFTFFTLSVPVSQREIRYESLRQYTIHNYRTYI